MYMHGYVTGTILGTGEYITSRTIKLFIKLFLESAPDLLFGEFLGHRLKNFHIVEGAIILE